VIAPNRIDFISYAPGVNFTTAWKKRIRSKYGAINTNWIDLDSLIKIKSKIDDPRHQEDVRILKSVKQRLRNKQKSRKK